MISPAAILNARILIVDDKEANVLLLAGMLRVAGYTSVAATLDPSKVCALHRENRYDLVLLDLQMPVMDGFEVMEGLKEMEADGYLSVLVITAQPDLKLRALEAGAKDFLSKPFDMSELRARVHNLLEVRLLHLQLTESLELLRVKTLAETKRLELELALAQETQIALLPRFLPQMETLRIQAYNNPTRYVGGDFYDFLQNKSGELIGILADVSGKGMPAALLSSMLLGALSMEFRSRTQPAEVLNRVNVLLQEKSLLSQFVTLFLFVLDRHGEGQFISAGHNPAYLFRAQSGEIEELHPDAFPLGIFDSTCYTARPFHLDKGDMLVVYSDGLTDAQNRQEDMFGEDRLRALIQKHGREGSQTLREKFLRAVDEFTEGVPQTDDITFVLVEKP